MSKCSKCGKLINTEKDKYVEIKNKNYCFFCGFSIYKSWEVKGYESNNKGLE